jgi:hypothetical protein
MGESLSMARYAGRVTITEYGTPVIPRAAAQHVAIHTQQSPFPVKHLLWLNDLLPLLLCTHTLLEYLRDSSSSSSKRSHGATSKITVVRLPSVSVM